MSRLPTIKKLLIEDVTPPSESQGWVRRLLYPINSFMTSVYSALNGNLTFGENIASATKELTFTTNSAYTSGTWVNLEFPRSIATQAQGVLILQLYNKNDPYTAINNGVTASWLDINGTITVNYISGLANSTEYFVRFLVI